MLKDQWGAKDYVMKGPPTALSIGMDKLKFEVLPIEVTHIVSLQDLSLYKCENLKTLPEGRTLSPFIFHNIFSE